MEQKLNQTPEGILGNGMLEDRERQGRGPGATEWRVESGEENQRGNRAQEALAESVVVFPVGRPDQRMCGRCAGEVVMGERASGRNRLREGRGTGAGGAGGSDWPAG